MRYHAPSLLPELTRRRLVNPVEALLLLELKFPGRIVPGLIVPYTTVPRQKHDSSATYHLSHFGHIDSLLFDSL